MVSFGVLVVVLSVSWISICVTQRDSMADRALKDVRRDDRNVERGGVVALVTGEQASSC